VSATELDHRDTNARRHGGPESSFEAAPRSLSRSGGKREKLG
jgi:hypothetical protein